jgi:acetyl-CoA acyltransferase 2
MAITAENLAEKYKITREECDAYGLRSQQTWAAAQDGGRFTAELAPVEIKGRKGVTQFIADEHARRDASLESMAKLPTAFKKDGVVTAGNASGICDGAAALSSPARRGQASRPQAARAPRAVARRRRRPDDHGHRPGAGDPRRARAGRPRARRLDLVEINEAFAAQYIACERELGLDRDKTNVDGGAIALGHPLGASGARITTHLVHELARRGGRYAVGSACIGGGQGIAVVLENAS